MAVIANPRTGSSSLMARRAPTTAPKKEAAHAIKGGSSHPKMRKNRRSQRMAQTRRGPIAETAVARARPGRNATAKVPRVQRAPGTPSRMADTAVSSANPNATTNPPAGEVVPRLADWLARIHAPIQGRKVPTIHQTGLYHQLLPPPTSYQRSV